MQVEGFRIHVVAVSAGYGRPARTQPATRPRRSDSADTESLSWFTSCPEPERLPQAALVAAVEDGSYWVPARDVSRSLVGEHIQIRP